MKKLVKPIAALAVLAAVASASSSFGQVALPASSAAPAGSVDTTKRGFEVRVYQTSVAKGGDTIALAIQQLTGGLLDPDGMPYPNTANLTQEGFDVNGIFQESGTINYNQDSTLENPTGGAAGAFTPDRPVPGITAEGGTDNFSLEATAFLQLAPGTYTFGVNSDDGFGVLAGIGTHPRDPFGTRLGAAEVARGATDTLFTVSVSQAGFYPIRMIFWEDGGGAAVEFFTVDSNNVKHLIGDVNDPDSIAAYRTTILPPTPYVSSTIPTPGQGGQLARPDIRITIEDGATPTAESSVKLSLNGVEQAGAAVVHSGTTTTVNYRPTTALAAGSTNNVTIVYAPSGANPATQTNSFSFVVAPYVSLAAALPVGSIDTTKPGFNWRIAQTLVNGSLNNTEIRAESLLAGSLIDTATGLPFANDATADTDGNFVYAIPGVINFNWEAGEQGSFTSTQVAPTQARADAPLPGVPGGDATTTQDYAVEITTFVELPAGVTTLGVNSDDGFRVSSSTNVTDNSGLLVYRLEVGKGASDVLFDVNAPTAGYYPIRILYYQGNGGGNVEFFSVKDGVKTLINDTDATALKAYAQSTLGTAASFGAIMPGNGAFAQSKNVIVSAGLYDGSGSSVQTNSITVSRNGAAATTGLSISTNGLGGTIITLAPPAAGYEQFSTQTVAVAWTDSAALRRTNTSTFTIGGGIVRKFYNDIGGGVTVNDLLNSEAYINNTPSVREEVSALDHPDRADNYGAEYLGYFYPAHTDDYTFYLSADDGAQLFLSTNEDPAEKVLIATQTVWNALRDYTGIGNDGGGQPYANRKSAPKHLIGGQKYFIHALQKEGGGGDSLSVAVSDTTVKTTVVNGEIGTSRVLPFVGIGYDIQPLSQTVNKGLPVTFRARAISAGEAAITYQWTRNGADIAGATSPTYTIDAVTFPGDNGISFAVRVTDGTVTATSRPAVLTVNNDTAAPSIVSAYAEDDHTIIVTFDEDITSTTATVAANYVLNQGITVVSATTYGPRSVKVKTTQALVEGTAYQVTITGVTDAAGNATASATVTANLVFSPGFVKYELFRDIPNTAITELTSSAKYLADAPDQIGYLSVVNWPDFADNYGIRVTGFVTPPVTGDYRFFIRSDDASAFYISTNESTANLGVEPNAQETGCCNPFQEPIGPDEVPRLQTSQEPIRLEEGKKYAFVALMKEGGGGDFLQLAVRNELNTNAASTLTPIRGNWIGTYANGAGISLAIATNLPASVVVTNGGRAFFSLALTATPTNTPVAIQYQVKAPGSSTFVDIVGANNLNYNTPLLTNASGTVYRAVVRGLGGIVLTSTETVVNGDGGGDRGTLTVTRSAGQVTITSTVAGVLVSAPVVTGPYTEVSPTPNTTFTVPTTGQMMFFQVKH